MDVRNVLVHGFNVPDPAQSIDLLRTVFEAGGMQVWPYHYGATNLLDARWQSDNYAEGLLSLCGALAGEDRAVIPVGHSNGCNVINLAAHKAATWPKPPFRRAVYLSPALNRDTQPADQMARIHVCHTRTDRAVWWAQFLVRHPWGDMGARGYTGKDERYTNIDAYPHVRGHSDWMTEAGRAWVAQHVVAPIAEEFGCKP